MALSPNDKLAAAILRVCEPPHGLAPYFGIMLRGLVRRPAEGLGTLATTDNGILLWDPAFVEKIDVNELAISLIHEVMHVVLDHIKRAAAMGVTCSIAVDPRARDANWAMDACINEDLGKAHKLPSWWITPETLKQPPGLVFEERFRLLEQEAQKQPKKGKGGQGGEGADAGAGSGGGGDGEEKPSAGKGWCGSCAGRPVPGEPAARGQKDKEGRSEADMGRLRRATAEAVKDAVAKGRGNVPGSLVVWADKELAPPKIHWRERLARVVRGAVAFKAGAADYTWNRVSRRQAGIGFGVGRPIVPALHAPIPKVSVLVDTSGSMCGPELEMAAAEVNGVLKAVGANVLVVTVDAQLQGAKECRDIKEALSLFKGGGGTVLMPGWAALLKKKPAADVIIVLTDGEIGGAGSGYPAVAPDAKVVWVVIGGRGPCCPWGDCVLVPVDGEAA